MAKIFIQLFMGEQDGWTSSIDVKNGRPPEMFYVNRACDDERIRKAKDAKVRMILTESLAVLAYEFYQAELKEGVPGGKQYRYRRVEHADRKLTDPAL